jgi:hypothetical protein
VNRGSRRRRIKIRLKSRDPRDAKRALDALKDGSQGPKSAAAQPNSPPLLPREELTQPLPDEQLETRVRQRAGQRLDQLEEQTKAANVAAGKPADAPAPASPEEIVSRRQRLWQWMGATGETVYRITVEATVKQVLEFLAGR